MQISIICYHRKVQQAGSVNRHGGENGSHHISHDGDASLVGAKHVVAVHVVRDERRLRHIDVHILKHVRAVGQIQHHGLVPVLRQTVSLQILRYTYNMYIVTVTVYRS